MTLLGVAGALTAYLYVLALAAVRSGKLSRRFGGPVTKREHPVLFWWTVVALIGIGSAVLCLAAIALLSSPPSRG